MQESVSINADQTLDDLDPGLYALNLLSLIHFLQLIEEPKPFNFFAKAKANYSLVLCRTRLFKSSSVVLSHAFIRALV
jgi:hypothetical protein